MNKIDQLRDEQIEKMIVELQKELERRKTSIDNCYQGHYAYNVINRTKSSAMVVTLYYCVGESKDDPKYLICDSIQIERYRDSFDKENFNEFVTRVDKFDNVYVSKMEFAKFESLNGEFYKNILAMVNTQQTRYDDLYNQYVRDSYNIRNKFGREVGDLINEKLNINI
jgi:uncharacterized protein YejL (UPF0352 family)